MLLSRCGGVLVADEVGEEVENRDSCACIVIGIQEVRYHARVPGFASPRHPSAVQIVNTVAYQRRAGVGRTRTGDPERNRQVAWRATPGCQIDGTGRRSGATDRPRRMSAACAAGPLSLRSAAASGRLRRGRRPRRTWRAGRVKLAPGRTASSYEDRRDLPLPARLAEGRRRRERR